MTQTKLEDQNDRNSKAFYVVPLLLALWTLSKKLQISFDLDMWPKQLYPFVFYMLDAISTEYQKNSEFKTPYFDYLKDTENDKNMLLFTAFNDVRKRVVVRCFENVAKIAFCKAMTKITYILAQVKVIKPMMTEEELRLAYDAKILYSMKDIFFVPRLDFNRAKAVIEKDLVEGKSVRTADTARRAAAEGQVRPLRNLQNDQQCDQSAQVRRSRCCASDRALQGRVC